jgi:hypothetical protein
MSEQIYNLNKYKKKIKPNILFLTYYFYYYLIVYLLKKLERISRLCYWLKRDRIYTYTKINNIKSTNKIKIVSEYRREYDY